MPEGDGGSTHPGPGRPRLVVFSSALTDATWRTIAAVNNAVSGAEWLIIVQRPRRSLRSVLRTQWRHLRRNGWRWVTFQARNVFTRALALPNRSGAARVGQTLARIVEVPDLHAPEVLEIIRAFTPDLGLSLAAPILKRSAFASPRLGTLNLHKGAVPDYRGMPPAFWELWNDEPRVGCTVHQVDDNLDTGDVVLRATVDRQPFSTLRGMQLQLDEVGAVLMAEATARVLAGTATVMSQPGGGRTWRRPTLAQEQTLSRRLSRRNTPASPLPRRIAKDARAMISFGAWRISRGRIAAPRVTVLLYHRVSDDARDLVTVGIEQFDRHMRLLRRRCQPVSLEDLLGYGTVPRSGRPLVAVTFDDGYRDNYDNAAPILERYDIPAAFFVSTGIVGTERRFPHDIERGNPEIPNMSWDEVRSLRRRGFTIGSHTVSHIDCAAVTEGVLRDELVDSMSRLRQELGGQQTLMFAYPYGRRDNITPRGIELVREAGYSACLSAYGGSNIGSVDAFDVRRKGIHWEFTDLDLLYACVGA